jgi:uncharacterized protein YaaR (DUF327 family)
MFLKSKNELMFESGLHNFSLQEELSFYSSRIRKEICGLLERLDIPGYEDLESSSLSESAVFSILSEMSEEDAADKLEELKEEINREREIVERKKDIARVMAWWAVGLLIAGIVFIESGLGTLFLIASIIFSIIRMVQEGKAAKAARNMKNSIPKLERLQDKCKSQSNKDKIDRLIDRIERMSD